MIKIKPEISTFKAAVQLTPFGAEPETVTIEYAYMPVSKAVELTKEKTIAEVLSEIVRGWGSEIDAPFSQEALAELTDNNPAIGLELFQGFFTSLSGARAKN